MIQLPFINTRLHLSAMMANYDVFADKYNADIERKRASDPKNIRQYQTLKPTHRALFKDLIIETGRKMLQNINNYQKINAEQGNEGTFSLLQTSSVIRDGAFVCSTNRYELSKHSKKELSTVYRNILRLMEAGIITRKIGHGKTMNFELFMNADFLIVSDKLNPEYNPLKAERTENKEAFSLSPQIAECKEKKNVQEQLINKLYSANAGEGQFLPSENEQRKTTETAKIGEDKPAKPSVNTIGSYLSGMTGAFTRTEEMPKAVPQQTSGKITDKPTGGRADVVKMQQDREIDFVKVFAKRDPAQWHGFHRLSHSAYFVDYLIHTIYAKRGVEIFPTVRVKAIEYVEKHYFPNPLERDTETIFRPCTTLDEYSNRLEQLKWCVDSANRYAARNKAFFVLINKYIDLENMNGFRGTIKWWIEAKKNENDKAKHLKNISDLRLLHETVRDVQSGKTTLIEAENIVNKHLDKYKYVFRHSLVTITNHFNK